MQYWWPPARPQQRSGWPPGLGRAAAAARSAELVLPGHLTWADYKELPGPDYSDPSIQPIGEEVEGRARPGRLPGQAVHDHAAAGGDGVRHSDDAAHSIPRDQVPAFYRDFLDTPQPLNNFQTMNRYWMEDSFGRYGVQLDAFGPYKLRGNSYQYFMNDQRTAATARSARRRPRRRARATSAPRSRTAWEAEVGAAKVAGVRQHLLHVGRAGRVRLVAGVRRDALEDQGGGPGRVRSQAVRPDADRLGVLALRRVVLLGFGVHRLAQRSIEQLN